MIDPNEQILPVLAQIYPSEWAHAVNITTARLDMPFTKSRGTIMSRLYERLTKASRRRDMVEVYDGYWQDKDNLNRALHVHKEMAYRRGVYDAYTALQDEMA